MKEKKITRILRIFMMLLTCILIALFFGIMILVSDMQGTARVVNYAGLVRGDRKSTRLNSSHLELSRMPSSA